MAFAGAVGVGILGVAFGAQISKHVNKSHKDQKMRSGATEIELVQLDQVYEILSCLVAGVYAADRKEEHASDYWTKLGYEKFNLEEQHNPTDKRADVDKQKSRVRWMLFRRHGGDGANCKELSQPLANGGKSQTPMPKYVVAIRGTITKYPDDHRANLSIVGEVLHSDKNSCKSVEKLIRQMVDEYSIEDVWVAGHSLGAAIALIATRELALEGKVLETHLFHSPYYNLDVCVKKMLKSIAKGAGDAFSWATGTDPKRIRKAVAPVARPVGKRVKIAAKATGRFLAPTYSKNMAEECDKLQRAKWTPHLYVNPEDAICNEFITHFQSASSNPPSSTLSSALVQGIARKGSRSNHLIPAAILYINNWGEGLPEAHKLHQWYKYNVVNLEVRSYVSESYTDSGGKLASP